MKKFDLYKKEYGDEKFVKRFDTVEEASDYVKDETEDEGNIFDYFTKEIEVTDITMKVKSYADACEVLGIQPMDEQQLKAAGFRQDEIARRQLETIVEALNEGWKPDWNDTNQNKYTVWFWIKPDKRGKGTAGLAFAYTFYAPSYTYTHIGSRLCFRTPTLARHAANTFTRLYEEILVTNY